MIERIVKLALAAVAPLLLLGCVLTPGKFVSTMSINADRTFAFTYKGEVIAVDQGGAMKAMSEKPDGDATDKSAVDDKAAAAEATETRNRAIAAALAKEAGYRSVVYQGKGKFLIDYAVAGRLTHTFIYPFNSDAEAIFPFIVIELRHGNMVRVKAPGFSSNGSSANATGGLGSGMGEAAKLLDGVFTLDTDAEIVSQNNEDGPTTTGARRTISWRATPLTKDAPTAVLRLTR